MAGYIGSKSSVTLVDGYSEAEADAEFVTKTGDTMSGNLEVTGETSAGSRLVLQNKSTGVEVNSSIRNHTNNYAYMFGGTNGLIFANNTGEDTRIKLQDSNEIEFITSSTNRMVIDSSGRVGIGTNSPASDGKLTIHGTDTDSGILLSRSSGNDVAVHNIGGTLAFRTGGESTTLGGLTERMRIDSSGNLLVGKDSANPTIAGVAIEADGDAYFTAEGANGRVLYANRLSSDGDIMQFAKDTATVGSIGAYSGDLYVVNGGGVGAGLRYNSGFPNILPCNGTGADRDNAIDLGASGVRFDDIYATNGTIQTSDFNEKQDIASLTATEMLVGKRISTLFKTFRWKDSVAEKGDNARTHTGVIAQDVQAAFTAEGLDAGDYALFISSTWWETQTEVPAVEAVEAVDEVTETTTDEDGNEVVTVITEAVEAVEAVDAYTRTDTYDTEDEAPEGATSKTRLGIRYPELLSFVAAYNEQRFASIEARLTALEA